MNASPGQNPVIAVATRSGHVESRHRGAVAVRHGDEMLLALGDVEAPVFARSATKPLQALPFVERGLPERLGLPPEELAVVCASHDGAAVHTAAVRSLLARGDLPESLLGCGPHAPFDTDARLDLVRRGEKPAKAHNNCSGKHTAFLLLARECGDDPAAYLDPACRSQQEVAAAVGAMTGLPRPPETGLDGCGAPTFRLPLSALATGFVRLANPDALTTVRAAACRTILDAAGRAPVLLAGERRSCTALIRTWPGQCFAKNGAEGVYAFGIAGAATRGRWPRGLGIAIKVDDGAERGYQPVLIDLLRHLGLLSEGLPAALAAFHRLPLLNTQKKVVGDVHSVANWDSGWRGDPR